jgi:hypothetical protein
MCAKFLCQPISETRYAHLFDLKDSGDDFYFDNVIDYVRRVMADIEKVDFDEQMKREVRWTAKTIELGAEICKLKLHPAESVGKVDGLTAMIDEISAEYQKLWNFRNYEKGIEKFMTNLQKRREELLALK